MEETAEIQELLERIRELQQELNKIYCGTGNLMDEKLLAVSREFDRLLVEYLRKGAYSAGVSGSVQR